jgi:hypothetical protein
MDDQLDAIENADLESSPEGQDRSVHRHGLDPISVAFGVIFAVLGFTFLLGDVDASKLSGAWGWAGLFGALGFLLIAMGVRRQRR